MTIITGITTPYLKLSIWVLNISHFYYSSPNYELAAAYQYILYLTTAYLNITFDMFSAGMMANICVQIDFLHDTASNIANGIVSEMQVSISKSSLAELNKRLVKCVDHHRTILR